jgi:hypothetical protein
LRSALFGMILLALTSCAHKVAKEAELTRISSDSGPVICPDRSVPSLSSSGPQTRRYFYNPERVQCTSLASRGKGFLAFSASEAEAGILSWEGLSRAARSRAWVRSEVACQPGCTDAALALQELNGALITSVRLSASDQAFTITFAEPLSSPRGLSTAAYGDHEITVRIPAGSDPSGATVGRWPQFSPH